MRIHTDNVDAAVRAATDAAAQLEGVYAETIRYGSRSRAGAFELRVTADKRPGRRPHNGFANDTAGEYGATWDEWGAIFAAIFAVDPDATCRAYDGADDYHWQTAGRFRHGMPTETHDQHRWAYEGDALTGTYSSYRCRCGATRRQMRYGHTFAEIAG